MKAYFWKPSSEEEFGIAVVAENNKEARKIGWTFWGCEYGNEAEFTEQRCTLIKDCRIDGLPKGPVDNLIEGLKHGLYCYAEESECPRCGRDGQRVMFDNGFYCGNCEGFDKCLKCGEWNLSQEDGKCVECKLKM